MSSPSAPTVSFELYPPRSEKAEAGLYETLEHLATARPEFISVTYGANGSTRGRSLAVLCRLRELGVEPMAHLTCVGTTYAQESLVIREFLDAGVTKFLALRGDPPEGSTENDTFLGDLGSAGELVQLVHRVQAEKEQFTQADVPGFPRAKRLKSGAKVTIAVAAFPNGHPRSRSVQQDLDTLLAKEAAGANLAITQLFFHADEYLRFVELARAAGVGMRILPGIMPVLSEARLTKIVELTGERMPGELLGQLQAAGSTEAQQRVGIEHARALSEQLLEGGAPGLHLYTFNQHHAVLAVLRSLGLAPGAPGAGIIPESPISVSKGIA
ncbi:methylenetetrahydrofolate reductase [Subtercola boreus]|uniref:Methylenetetrahydrofolate reductase n=1 Tax=Subtercola boreus TaxID=120213 RepID=A0A3E0WBC0_9MICO|nr:methylenetetrahydrofolate reductase [Subtercola boreus]RFA21152.1 5,10-methylenetetrahydrofolate reductase [Subtercola boreus]RFA21535.1 5,10-methylenetetrahydrofolate reductase [Subtercola boreus]RFA27505.1 5,10-methylenetetrahydrofolate reductase [Subtercola boreus]